MSLTNPFFTIWKEQKKKDLLEKCIDFTEIDNGFCSKTSSFIWEEALFCDISTHFTSSDYLYAYSYGSSFLSQYFDFEHCGIDYRFCCKIEKDTLYFTLYIRDKEDIFYRYFTTREYFELLNTEDVIPLCKLTKNLCNYFINKPEYRLKILTGALKTEQTNLNPFFEYATTFNEHKLWHNERKNKKGWRK